VGLATFWLIASKLSPMPFLSTGWVCGAIGVGRRSVDGISVESMFDGSLPEIADLAGLDDAALVDAVRGWARAENAACARKQAVMAELFCRRTGLPADERELWWIDPEAAVTAELAAAQNISRGMALHQTHRGIALRDRLPEVAALFEAGLISDLLVRTIVWRTYLIGDPDAMAAVDAELAQQVGSWGPLSITKTEQAIDALVDKYDPAALRRSRTAARTRDVAFGSPTDEAGFTSLWARLYAGDAKVLKQRVEAMARGVCEADPRSLGERRADALAALATGQDLVCECGATDCPHPTSEGAPATAVVHVVADAATVTAAQQPPGPAGPTPADPTPSEPTPPASANDAVAPPAPPDQQCPAPAALADHALPQAAEVCADTKTASRPASATTECPAPPAFVIGGGIMPAPLLAATLERATVREIVHPGDAPPENSYTPSRKLAEFVRCRDLTCRWLGCDVPADRCDLDHTVPWPVGPTHASNMKCYCRFHHLLKTFWCGVGGWSERQLPDGTLILSSLTGHTYTTYPGSKKLFPVLCEPTATLWQPGQEPTVDPRAERGAMMPKRKHTRAHNRQRGIDAERRLNDDHVAERNKPPPF
jgi:Domain of unknown function (DUF222)